MKRKGFTLVELLAVIVILAVIAIIAVPMIGNIIEDSKKKALEQSVHALVESANYFTISNSGVYEFIFNETKKGETTTGKKLNYKGDVEVEGKLYIDNDKNISLCLMNENYYAYKNYNGGIYVGETKDDTCIVGYDALTNKYVAMLDDGTGSVGNVYSKNEIDNMLNTYASKSDLENYALKSDLENLVTTTNAKIDDLENNLSSNKTFFQLYEDMWNNAELLYNVSLSGSSSSISIDKDEYPYLIIKLSSALSTGWWSETPHQFIKTSTMSYSTRIDLGGVYCEIRHDVSTEWQTLTTLYSPNNVTITIYGIKAID